jgi:DNA-binding response OmpR family regulator
MRILVVEDDECVAKTLENLLGNQRYLVDVANDGLIGWELAEAFSYDLILLDVMLPKLDGIKLCQRLRSHNYQTPVLLLTAQNSSSHKVIGLDAGADDYVVKPFDVTELLARIRVLLRRRNAPIQSVFEWEYLRLDFGSCEAIYKGELLNLTPKEYRLLELFVKNSNIVFSRSKILDHLWSVEEAPKEDTVTAHIKGLRQKLSNAGAPGDFIETVYGLGYRLKEIDFSQKDTVYVPDFAPSIEKKQQTKNALTDVWEKLKYQSQERLQILQEATCVMMEYGMLNAEQKKAARRAAHKLAGSLGIFGFDEGSRLACSLEQLLQPEANLNESLINNFCDLVTRLSLELKKPAFSQFDKLVLDLVLDDAV